jgi:hypothetical protein
VTGIFIIAKIKRRERKGNFSSVFNFLRFLPAQSLPSHFNFCLPILFKYSNAFYQRRPCQVTFTCIISCCLHVLSYFFQHSPCQATLAWVASCHFDILTFVTNTDISKALTLLLSRVSHKSWRLSPAQTLPIHFNMFRLMSL